MWLTASEVPLVCIPTPNTRNIRAKTPSCWKNFVKFEWWHVSKHICLNQSPHELACWLKSAMCFSSSHLCLCLEMSAGIWDLLRLKKPLWPLSAFRVSPSLPEFLQYLQEVPYCKVFYFPTNKIERRMLLLLPEVTLILSKVNSLLSSLALGSGVCWYTSLFYPVLSDLCLIWS